MHGRPASAPVRNPSPPPHGARKSCLAPSPTTRPLADPGKHFAAPCVGRSSEKCKSWRPSDWRSRWIATSGRDGTHRAAKPRQREFALIPKTAIEKFFQNGKPGLGRFASCVATTTITAVFGLLGAAPTCVHIPTSRYGQSPLPESMVMGIPTLFMRQSIENHCPRRQSHPA
jgi:hypothetical protein